MSGDYISKLTILLVDDYEDSRFVLRIFLESHGYGVVEAANGQQAIELAQSECPDLILLDLNIPVLDGLVATERIRASAAACRDVPIIAITAFDTYGMKEAALEAGCNGYIAKPIDFDQMAKILHRNLESLTSVHG
jgi:two-component system, cell cycle response regulator DivK